MPRDLLTSLLAAAAPSETERTPTCPDELRIAGYVDGGLLAAEREQVELHLADCAHCLGLVELLCRERDPAAVEDVRPAGPPPDAPANDRRRGWWAAPHWAVAAAILLTVPLLLQVSHNPERGAEGQEHTEAPATRALATDAPELRVIAPAAGSTVPLRNLTFRWTTVSGTPYYDVRVVTEDGAVVVQQRINETSWRPPAQLGLEAGADYFVHVDAYPAGDVAVSSDHLPFRVTE